MMEKNLIQLLTDGLFCEFPLAPQVPESGGGIIQHGILPDGTFNFVIQTGEIRKLRMPGGDAGTPGLRVLQIPAKPLDGRAEPGDGTELGRQQHAALRSLDQAGFGSVCF